MRKIIVMAHRGGCNETIENSWIALEYAKKLGYKYFETDVRATKDNVVVIHHDDNLDRVTDTVGTVEEMTWQELSTVSHIGGGQIVRLEDALKKYKDFFFNIDIKNEHVIEPFIKLIESMPQVKDRICVASFSTKRLRKIRRAFGNSVPTSLGMSEVLRLKLASTLTLSPKLFAVPTSQQNVVAVQVPEKFGPVRVVTKRFVSQCHKSGMAVQVWTVDTKEQMERLINLGVDGIFTDSPSYAKQVMQKLGLW